MIYFLMVERLALIAFFVPLLGVASRAADFSDSFERDALQSPHWGLERLPSSQRKGGPTSAVLQSAVVRSGARAAAITLLPTDTPIFKGHRSEIADNYTAPFGSQVLYTFSLFLPENFQLNQDQDCVIAQFHDQDSVKVKDRFEKDAHKPPIAFRYFHDGSWRITIDREGKDRAKFKLGEFQKGVWHDFVVRVAWNHAEGKVSISHNGAPIIDHAGGVGFPAPSPSTGEGPYFKAGPYCGTEPAPSPLTLYLDNYSRTLEASPRIK